jgi:6-phosphogluconolactonase
VKFYKLSSSGPVVEYLVTTIQNHLKKDQKVLWMVTGGSAIKVAAKASHKLGNSNLRNLYVTLTDERYVPASHEDANWKQLQDAGFNLPEAQLRPVLSNQSIEQTTQHYANILQEVLSEADYKIGLFGMGPDGHIAALFPHFPQVDEEELYATALTNSPKPPPKRLMMTPRSIKELDEAVIFACGAEKKEALDNLGKKLKPSEQPAQILKTLPRLTIYNDQIGEKI